MSLSLRNVPTVARKLQNLRQYWQANMAADGSLMRSTVPNFRA
jgi:hypothetical protein